MNLFRRGRSTSSTQKGKDKGNIITRGEHGGGDGESSEGNGEKRARSHTLGSVGRQQSVVLHSKKEIIAGLMKDASADKEFLISKSIIDFNLGDSPCPIQHQMEDTLVLANNSKKKLKFKFEPSAKKEWKLHFEPSSGTIDPQGKKKNTKKIEVRMTLLVAQSMDERINLSINGGKENIFLTIRAHPEQGVYGVAPHALEFCEDCGFHVPIILAQMRKYIVAQGGLHLEGIFRLAGNATEMGFIKNRMNTTHNFDPDARDQGSDEAPEVNAIANLVKVWYRELPVPLLNSLPASVISNTSDIESCVRGLDALEEMERTLLGWLINFLADAAEFKATNKMTEQNLAIVVAPNLYNPPSQDPMEGLMLSQKSTQFLHNLIAYETEMRARSHHSDDEIDAAAPGEAESRGEGEGKESDGEEDEKERD